MDIEVNAAESNPAQRDVVEGDDLDSNAAEPRHPHHDEPARQPTHAESSAAAPLLQPFDNLDPTQKLWRQRLKWGVLVPGSTDVDRPGHLGLGSSEEIVAAPRGGDFYA